MANAGKHHLHITHKDTPDFDQIKWRQNMLDIERWASRIFGNNIIYDERSHPVGRFHGIHDNDIVLSINVDEDDTETDVFHVNEMGMSWEFYHPSNNDSATFFIDIDAAFPYILFDVIGDAVGSYSSIYAEHKYVALTMDDGLLDHHAFIELNTTSQGGEIDFVVSSATGRGTMFLVADGYPTSGGTHLYGAFGIDDQTVLDFHEVDDGDPDAPAAQTAVVFCKDNGAGKTGLYARFPTGAIQQIALEP